MSKTNAGVDTGMTTAAATATPAAPAAADATRPHGSIAGLKDSADPSPAGPGRGSEQPSVVGAQQAGGTVAGLHSSPEVDTDTMPSPSTTPHSEDAEAPSAQVPRTSDAADSHGAGLTATVPAATTAAPTLTDSASQAAETTATLAGGKTRVSDSPANSANAAAADSTGQAQPEPTIAGGRGRAGQGTSTAANTPLKTVDNTDPPAADSSQSATPLPSTNAVASDPLRRVVVPDANGRQGDGEDRVTSPAGGERSVQPHEHRSLFRTSTTAAGEGRSGSENSPLNTAQHLQLVQRVARALHAAPVQGGTLRLRLHPQELGALRLEVVLERGALSARIEAESPMARNVLLDALPQLRDRLAAQGVRVEQFTVDVGWNDEGSAPRQPGHDRSQHQLATPTRAAPAAPQEDRPSSDTARPDLSVLTLQQLNVVI